MPWVPADKLGPITLVGGVSAVLRDRAAESALRQRAAVRDRRAHAQAVRGLHHRHRPARRVAGHAAGHRAARSAAGSRRSIDPFAITTVERDDPLLERRREERAARFRSTGTMLPEPTAAGSPSRSRCSLSSWRVFRLRLQHGVALRAARQPTRRRRPTVAPRRASRHAALRQRSWCARSSGAEPVSLPRRSSAKRRSSRSRPSASSI